MLAIISPAKKLDENYKDVPHETFKPVFNTETQNLVDELKKYNKADISKLMSLSDKLSELNYNRYQTFARQKQIPAAFCFKGDVYAGLDIETIAEAKLPKLNEHLVILSGLYGLLRPFDLMKPYRLEMGTKINIGNYKNLYEFWGDKITGAINNRATELNSSYIINLASNEYFKAVKPKLLQKPLISVDFKENKKGEFKTIGLFAKRARGLFVRFMVDNEIKTTSDLKQFSSENYQFNSNLSEEGKLVFTR